MEGIKEECCAEGNGNVAWVPIPQGRVLLEPGMSLNEKQCSAPAMVWELAKDFGEGWMEGERSLVHFAANFLLFVQLPLQK